MSKFFDRITGTFVEQEMTLFTYIDRIFTSSKTGYKRCYIQFKRGEMIERSEQTFDIAPGEVVTQISQIFSKQSIFYRKKDSKIPEYQAKQMEIRIFGQSEGGLPVSLGFKTFNVSNYVSRIRHKMEICLDESTLQRNKLHLQVTILPLADSKKITEAFLRGLTDQTSDQIEQPVFQKL